VQVPVHDGVLVTLHADAVGRDLGHVDTGLERAPFPSVNDHAHRGIGVELEPRVAELVSHLGVHRVELVGPVVDEPTDWTVALDLEVLVRRIGHPRAPVCSSAPQSARLMLASRSGGSCAIVSASDCAAARSSDGGSTTSLTRPIWYARAAVSRS